MAKNKELIDEVMNSHVRGFVIERNGMMTMLLCPDALIKQLFKKE